jgi:hypothetical protein
VRLSNRLGAQAWSSGAGTGGASAGCDDSGAGATGPEAAGVVEMPRALPNLSIKSLRYVITLVSRLSVHSGVNPPNAVVAAV